VAAVVAGLGGAEGQAAERLDSSPRRGMVFLASDVGDSTSLEEILDFVDSCRIDFVVFDFAWITGTWQQAKWDELREAYAQLKKRDVRVAFMYRPRALSAGDARVHFAQDEEGKIAKHHLHLCLAHADSQAWGAQWGARILKEIPSLDTIIIYNLLSVCMCPECRDGKGQELAERFLNRCRSEWSRVRPGVQVTTSYLPGASTSRWLPTGFRALPHWSGRFTHNRYESHWPGRPPRSIRHAPILLSRPLLARCYGILASVAPA
jgi:hypothetical protein